MERPPIQDNRSVFYAPIRVRDMHAFIHTLAKDARFVPSPKDRAPQYLLPYATDIYKNDALYRAFDLEPSHFPALCMFAEHMSTGEAPTLTAVRISCFATGCAFAEFHVIYHGQTLEDIENFSFRFKNASKTDTRHGYELTMLNALHALLPTVEMQDFCFTGSAFKRECRVFHHIFMIKPPGKADIERHLRYLSRGYHAQFSMPKSDSDYDMIYQPYDYDHWAGSQEGLVNLFHHSGNRTTDRFINSYKREQLLENYGFMYLLLLNQRFSAIAMISDIARYQTLSAAEKESLNERITKLKTVFAFNIISDDQVYQNVYRRMYALLDIDRLLDDIQDNEQQVEALQHRETVKRERFISSLLLGLSILSIFSALMDAAGFFDRIPAISPCATVLSGIAAGAVILLTLAVWLLRGRS